MPAIRKLLISTAAVISLAGCAQSPPPAAAAAKPDAATDEAAVRAVNPSWFKAYAAGDADGVALLYASDAVVSAPGAAALRGLAAIREFVAKDITDLAAGGLTYQSGASTEVGVSGDLAWEWGTYTVTDKAGQAADVGKFTTIFARRDGEWKIIRDTWNSDMAPAAAPAPAAAKK